MLLLVYLNDLLFNTIAKQLKYLASIQLPEHSLPHALIDQASILPRIDPLSFKDPSISKVYLESTDSGL